MATSERVVLVDGSNLMYRAFFGLPGSLMTSGGLKTNAIFGFATMFRKLFKGKTPAMGAVMFDAPGPTFRDERYPEYKATRSRMPDDLRVQIPRIEDLCRAHGFPILKVSGIEADDVIGTLTRQALEAGHEVHIISSDKDFAQLIGDSVKMVDTLRDVTFDAELVRKKWGVLPEQIIDYLALLGDKVDNVPGVPGIGQKGAVDLLKTYGSLDRIYDNLDAGDANLKGRSLKALTEGRELALLSRDLVTIEQHATLPVNLDGLVIPTPDPKLLNEIFVELEFFSLISDEGRDALSTTDAPVDYARFGSVRDLSAFLDGLGDAPVAVIPVFDEEEPAITPIIGLAVAPRTGVARYIAFEGQGSTLGARAWSVVHRWLGDAASPKVCHDMKSLWRGLHRQGIAFEGTVFDTRLASFLVNPTKVIPHRLDQLTREFLQRTVRPAKTVIGAGQKLQRFSEADPDPLTEWACHLADAIVEMYPTVAERLESEGQTAQLMTHDLPLSYVLGQMEIDGVLVDAASLATIGDEFQLRLDDYETEIYALAGHRFHIASPKQLGTVLFDELGLPVIKRTKTGYSTNAEVLDKLSTQHPLPDLILKHRMLAKLINTYTLVLQRAVNPATGRVHATFQQTTGATGRLISTDPDLQRTPIHTPEGKRIRAAFVAPPGWKLISADWSQIELRLLAHFTESPGLIEAFRDGLDVHKRTASAIFEVPIEAVTHEQRGVGKTVNFATIYGQGATALGQLLKIPRKEAKRYIEGYFKHYGTVRTWLDATMARALETGYVETMLGRRRYIPELSANSPMERQAGMRIAANTPIQGSAADLCKLAMLEVPKRFEASQLATRMLLQIHDELVFEAPEAEVDTVVAIVRDVMENAASLLVPLVVDVGVGDSWAEAH